LPSQPTPMTAPEAPSVPVSIPVAPGDEWMFEDTSGQSNGNPSGVDFWTLVREDVRAHDGDWTAPGFLAIFVHRCGNLRMDVRSRAMRVPLGVLYRIAERCIRTAFGIELPYSAKVGRNVGIHHQSGIVISGYVTIGDGCVIRQNVTIGIRRVGEIVGPVLGRNVDVGAGAVILGTITIGDDVSIGANAVVLDNVPDGAVAVGVPARIIPGR
jgi:serine O-acetyltransferase